MPFLFILAVFSQFNFKFHIIQDEMNILNNLNDYFSIENKENYKIFTGFRENYNIDENFIAKILIANEGNTFFNLKKLQWSFFNYVSKYYYIFSDPDNQHFQMYIEDLKNLKDDHFFYLMIYPKNKGKIALFIFYCYNDIIDDVQVCIGKSIFTKITHETQSLESKFAEEMGVAIEKSKNCMIF